jgi:hypothetical protein
MSPRSRAAGRARFCPPPETRVPEARVPGTQVLGGRVPGTSRGMPRDGGFRWWPPRAARRGAADHMVVSFRPAGRRERRFICANVCRQAGIARRGSLGMPRPPLPAQATALLLILTALGAFEPADSRTVAEGKLIILGSCEAGRRRVRRGRETACGQMHQSTERWAARDNSITFCVRPRGSEGTEGTEGGEIIVLRGRRPIGTTGGIRCLFPA